MDKILLDTNIVLRLYKTDLPMHIVVRQAIPILKELNYEICIVPQNIYEFWAVASRPIEANGLNWDNQLINAEIDFLVNRFCLLIESSNVYMNWLKLVTKYDIKGKKAHDTRLVASMLANGISKVLTFNTVDFKIYSEIEAINPMDINGIAS